MKKEKKLDNLSEDNGVEKVVDEDSVIDEFMGTNNNDENNNSENDEEVEIKEAEELDKIIVSEDGEVINKLKGNSKKSKKAIADVEVIENNLEVEKSLSTDKIDYSSILVYNGSVRDVDLDYNVSEDSKVNMGVIKPKSQKISTNFTEINSRLHKRRNPTGSLFFDAFLGGGYPSSVIEMIAAEAVGKTHLALCACKAVVLQKSISKKRDSMVALYLDYEYSLDNGEGSSLIDYMKIPYDKKTNEPFIYATPYTMEEGEIIINDAIKKYGEDLGIVVIDSLPMMMPLKMKEKASGSEQPGTRAAAHNVFLSKFQQICPIVGCTMLVLNQFRQSFNFSYGGYSNPNSPFGGSASKYTSETRLIVSKKESITEDYIDPYTRQKAKKEIIAELKIQLLKNKQGPSSKLPTIDIYMKYGQGIDDVYFFIKLAGLYPSPDDPGKMIISRGGAVYNINLPGVNPNKARGAEELRQIFRDNKNLGVLVEYFKKLGLV